MSDSRRILKRLRDAEHLNRTARGRASQAGRIAAGWEFPFRELALAWRAWLNWRAGAFARRARRLREAFRSALDADASLHRRGRSEAYAKAKQRERPPWANDA